jgi:hypothetical protein
MAIINSPKLQYQEFIKSLNNEPLQCLYQKLTNDTYTSSGYSFTVKSPGQGLLLDPDIWIHYRLTLTEAGNNTLTRDYMTVGGNAFVNQYAGQNNRIAFRGGNIMQKATQNMNVIINGHSLTCEPWKFIDILNRLYISDDQSKHEFSSSGGKFDNGNHSHRCLNDVPSASLSGAINNQTLGLNIYQGYHSAAEVIATGAAVNSQAIAPAPPVEYFFNEGFSDRCFKFADLIRRSQAPNAAVGVQYGANAATNTYTVDLYERVPIPPFKMYSNDSVYGMIPHIKDMTIKGQFSSNLSPLIIRASIADISTDVGVSVPANASNSDACEILLKWYTPPQNFIMPREISIPLRKINVYPVSQTIPALGAADNPGVIQSIQQYNISLDSIPDLLIIYLRYRMDSYTNLLPDDYMFEMQNLNLNIEGSSGKLNQVQTIDLYNKWKKLLKHGDSKLPSYDQWRRYMCVAALQPDDYGVMKGPGYDNPVTLGVSFNANNWWNIPAMGLVPAENYAGQLAELIVCSIYDKWSLTIRDSGSAQSELTRIGSKIEGTVESIGLSERKPLGGGLRHMF